MLKDWFSMSKREQISFTVLFVILLCLLLAFFIKPSSGNIELDPDLVKWAGEVHEKRMNKYDTIEYFSFDPNVVNVREMQKLGFSDKAIINLIKYRESGGVFNEGNALSRIYGIDSTLFSYLYKYIVIEDKKIEASEAKVFQSKKSSNQEIIKSTAALGEKPVFKVGNDDFVIEINTADTAEFDLLYGIGPVLSRRIVNYRSRIGGFFDVDQLTEVYGVSVEVIDQNRKKLSVDQSLINPMDIGKAGLRRMKDHPYLNYYKAKAISDARKAGALESITQFKNNPVFEDADWQRLNLYFVVENGQ